LKSKKNVENSENTLPVIKKNKIADFYDRNKRKILLGFLLTIFIIIFLFIQNMRYKEPKSIEEPPPYESTLSIREDITGKKPVLLEKGNYVVGVHIPAGRYSATTPEHSFGSVIVYELDSRVPEVSEIIGVFSETAYVESIALTLTENQEIKLDGSALRSVLFTPLETKFRSELTTGIWEVGLDIEPGTYNASSKEGLLGSITILEDTEPIASERFTDDRKSSVVTLELGQLIRISRIPTVVFDKIIRE